MSTRRFVLLAVLAASVCLPLTAQQRPPARDAALPAIAGTCVISGAVTASDAGARPVRRATVTVASGDNRGSRSIATDDRGRFAIAGLAPGRYTVTVTKPGWVTTIYGARRPSRGTGMALALTEGQHVSDLALTLTRGAVITGRIVDQQGTPQVGIRPIVLQHRTLAGERVLAQAAPSGVASLSMVTNDRGEYRIYGLAPGTYFIAASLPSGGRLTTAEEIEWARQLAPAGQPAARGGPPPGPTVAYPPTYYPDATDAQGAAAIVLGAGEERGGIDLVLQQVFAAKVSGVVSGPDGQPLRGVQLFLIPTVRGTTVSTRQSAVSNPTGRFEFASVIPGQYTLSARGSDQTLPPAPLPRAPAGVPPPPPPPPPPAGGAVEFIPAGGMQRPMNLWAMSDLAVTSQDLDDVHVTLEPGLTISGRIAFDATTLTPPVDLTRVQVTVATPRTATGAMGLTGTMQTGNARADGTFEIHGVAPDSYVLSAFAPGGTPAMPWVLRSAMLGGQNIADRAVPIRRGMTLSDVVITFTDRSAELAGRLLDGAGRPAPEFFVFVFPADRTLWTPNAPRHLRAPTRPASDGSYRIAALPPGEYFVAALTEIDDADIFDAAFLEQVAAAAFKISIAEGEKKTQDLQIR
jgi:sarcosine oxidase gamma subunit